MIIEVIEEERDCLIRIFKRTETIAKISKGKDFEHNFKDDLEIVPTLLQKLKKLDNDNTT